MKSAAVSSLLATAGLAALSATSVSSAILPAPSPVVEVKRNADGTQSYSLPLVHKRRPAWDDDDQFNEFINKHSAYIEHKYGAKTVSKNSRRQTVGLTEEGPDTQYFAQASVGTPPQNFNLVVDTGSADLWVALSTCTNSQCQGTALYDAGASSSSVQSNTPFDIQYGSGAVEGTLYADTVSLAGYTVYNTTLGGVTRLAPNSIQAPTSGIMGLAFEQLATSGATPFPEVLFKSGVFADPAFTFQLARHPNAQNNELNPGGVLTMGRIDPNQYSGDITYTNLPTTPLGEAGYWAIPMDALTINGNAINTNAGLSVIDTGTTLIGGPPDLVQQIYQQIPGAQLASASSGYYAFPCSSNVQVTMTFGGKQWTINPSDFNAGAISSAGACLGAIFAVDLGQNAPDWIVGDSFLKNVFSVFEYNPRRIGFASLANGGTAQEVATTSGAVGSGGNVAAATSGAAPASTGGVEPSITQNAGSAATATGIVGGSGLPAPVAATSVATSSATLANSDQSASSSSSATRNLPLFASLLTLTGLTTLGSAVFFGMAFAQ